MAKGTGPVHPETTERSGYRYFFYEKHHQPGVSRDAQWLPPPGLTQAQEFEVFNRADLHELHDDQNNPYGMRRRQPEESVPQLGTRGEQAAKFPATAAGEPWHGYPLWPIATPREGEKPRTVPKDVLARMVELGLMTDPERRRFQAGKHM